MKGQQPGDIYAGDYEEVGGVGFWRSYTESGEEVVRTTDPERASELISAYHP